MEFYKIKNNRIDLESYHYPNQKIGVIVHIEDKDGKILLQQRGMKSRDENGLYETVGGKLEKNDKDFKAAILREMKEEMGESVNITLSKEVGIYHILKKDINWVFVIFVGKYMGGEIRKMEPDKCMGYHFFTYEEALNSTLVTEGSKYLIKSINNYFFQDEFSMGYDSLINLIKSRKRGRPMWEKHLEIKSKLNSLLNLLEEKWPLVENFLKEELYKILNVVKLANSVDITRIENEKVKKIDKKYKENRGSQR